MDLISILLLSFAAALFFIVFIRNPTHHGETNLPPRVRGLPLLGYVPFLRPNRCVVLKKLHDKHGPVFLLPFFNSEMLIIGSIDSLREALIDKGDAFANRPAFRYLRKITMGKGIIFTDGDFWQQHRRFVLRALRDLGFAKTLSIDSIHEEVQTLRDYVDLQNTKSVDTKFIFSKMTNNVICSIVFGQRFEGVGQDQIFDKLFETVTRVIEIDSKPIENAPFFFPFITEFPFLMKIYKLFAQREICVSYIHKYIYEKLHKTSVSIENISEPRNLIEAMLLHRRSLESEGQVNHNFDDKAIVADVFDLFVAGTDTTAATLTWSMALMSVYPDIQNKARHEIKKEIGLEKMPSMKDRSKLNFTLAVLDEIARYASIVPTSLLHLTSEDTKLKGFDVPKDTLVIPNLYAIHRDSRLWKNPLHFDPNNFLDSDGIYRPSDNLVSFSLGRRSCLGESLARMELFIFFVSTLQHYEVSLPSNDGVNVEKILEAFINTNKSVEKTLIRQLLRKYEKFGVVGRPVQNSSHLITVNFGIALAQILDLDENKQILRTNCWSRYRWFDSLLSWDPKEYDNISQVRVFPHHLWTPDIKLYNFADERLKEYRDARVVVHHDSTILWVPQALFKSTCSVEITYFPFDTQVCNLEFGSWTYDITQLDIQWWKDVYTNATNPYVDFSNYVVSNEWHTDGEEELGTGENRTRQIKSRRFYRNVTQRDSLGRDVLRSYPVLQYRVRLKRNPSFYVSILVIPCILLSCLTLVLFWLPPESPAKMMLGMNIFVAFFVLLLLLAESTPSAVKNFPLIGGYYCLNMVMITLSTFLAVIVINLYFRGDRRGPVPACARRVMMDGLGRLLLVRQNIPLPDPKKMAAYRAAKTYRSGQRRERRPRSHAVLYNKFQMEDMSSRGGGASVESGNFECQRETVIDKPDSVHFADDVKVNIQPKRVEVIPKEAIPTSVSAPSHSGGTTRQQPHRPNINKSESSEQPPADSPITGFSFSSMLEKDVQEIKRYIRLFVSRQKDKERKNQIAMEWRTVALVLDRLFFCLYVIAITVAIIVLLPKRGT